MKLEGQRKSKNVKQGKPLSEGDKRRKGHEDWFGYTDPDVADKRMRKIMQNDRIQRFRARHSSPNPLAKAVGATDEAFDKALNSSKIKAKLYRKRKPKTSRNPFAKAAD